MADPPTSADILIIGGGTAGCVLANRLSANPNLSVVLLEAGEDRNADRRVYTPGRAREMYGHADFDWAYVSEPEEGLHTTLESGRLENGRRMQHPRGKVVGGTSAINSFALIYPSASEMEFWGSLGNEGWGWEGVEPYLRKFQTLVRPDQDLVEKLNLEHNFAAQGDGPIQATFPMTYSPLQQAWLDAFRGLGLENERDPLKGHAVGGAITANHIHGERRERSHAGVAYLDPVRHRGNLRVVTGARVRRIVFGESGEGEVAVATSVEYEVDGKVHEIGVRKEVVLSAGVFGSPQLLELSGVGDSGLLNKHGINTVYHNAAVGENLKDHIRAGVSYEAADDAGLPDVPSSEEAAKLYDESRSGLWAENAAYTFAYMPLVPFSSPTEIEEVCQAHLNNEHSETFHNLHTDFLKRQLLSPSEATATAYLSRRPPPLTPSHLVSGKSIALNTMLSHPLSSGNVHITSTNPSDKPAVRFNYYAHPLDLEIHARHLLAMQQLARTPALSALIKTHGARYPAEPLDVETAKAFLRANATTNYHPCGTCAMLPEQMGGVVDGELRVYGTGNVRVVDASVFPVIPRGNIIATVYAVAEKAAGIMLRDLEGK